MKVFTMKFIYKINTKGKKKVRNSAFCTVHLRCILICVRVLKNISPTTCEYTKCTVHSKTFKEKINFSDTLYINMK